MCAGRCLGAGTPGGSRLASHAPRCARVCDAPRARGPCPSVSSASSSSVIPRYRHASNASQISRLISLRVRCTISCMLDTEQGWDLHCSISQHLSARAAGHARPITATAACSTSPRSIQPCANAQGQCTTRQALRQAGSAFQRRAEFERVLPKVSAFAGEMPIDCKVHPISLFLERSSLAQIALRTTDAREVVGIADIEGAERVMGVAYTEAERRQMLGNLEGQIISARARRKVRLDNSMPMASRFDPRLPSFRAPAPQRALRFASVVPKAVPDDDEDIAFAGIGQLSAWLSSGALTSRRLTEIYLARIDALGPRLERFATVSRDRALAEADAADALLRAGVNLGPRGPRLTPARSNASAASASANARSRLTVAKRSSLGPSASMRAR